MVWRALSLPLLEPLTAGRQQRLARLCAACLLAALTVAASGAAVAAPDEAETHAVDVLVRALEVFECVQSVLRASTRSGGHVSRTASYPLISAETPRRVVNSTESIFVCRRLAVISIDSRTYATDT